MNEVQGTIARLQREKGFGFIRGKVGGTEYFFHRTDCLGCVFDDLSEGDDVTLLPEYNNNGKGNGWRARNVSVE